MNTEFKASVIVSTYKWPEALSLVLCGLMLQTENDFEVLIGEDAQDESTKIVIDSFRTSAFFPIRHFRQTDQGFRKSEILNKAILEARGQTIIFLDGDCIPHRHYVEQHLLLQEPGYYVAGRRVDLSKEFSKKLTPEIILSGGLVGKSFFVFIRFAFDCLTGNSGPLHRAYMVENKTLRRLFGFSHVDDMKGCNYSLLRKDLLEIDGYDESYQGYGREDTDVEVRLQNLGLKIKSAKNLCIQFHLWHSRREFTPKNDSLLEELKRSKRYKAIKGISMQ